MEMQKQSHQSLQLAQEFTSQFQVGRSQQLNLANFSANGKGVKQNDREGDTSWAISLFPVTRALLQEKFWT